MLTIFTTPKAFRDEFADIQRRALTSWTLLEPRPEIIVFGNEEGTYRASRELGLTHVPDVGTSEFGTPLVSALFATAEELTKSPLLCYVNADIILLSDFARAAHRLTALGNRVLMVGQRCTVPLVGREQFDPGWEQRLRAAAASEGVRDNEYYVDYFLFSRGLFEELPPFTIGRPAYDNWLIWKAKQSGAFVIDATEAVLALHQAHGYSHIEGGREGAYEGQEAARNRELADYPKHLLSIADATHAMTREGTIQRARGGKYRAARRARVVWRLRHNRVMQWSLPLRHKLGLRWSALEALRRRLKRRSGTP